MHRNIKEEAITKKPYVYLVDKNKNRKTLGKGTYAVTYLVKYNGKKVAAKESIDPNPKASFEDIQKSFFRETQTYQKFKDSLSTIADDNKKEASQYLIQNLASLTFNINGSTRFVQILEFGDQGNVRDWIKRNDYTWPMRHETLRQVAMGLSYMHGLKKPMVHGDIKPENVVRICDENGILTDKIIDFGFTKEVDHETDQCGSPMYSDPQQLTVTMPRSTELDIWSFGVMLSELFNRETPYKGKTTAKGIRDFLFALNINKITDEQIAIAKSEFDEACKQFKETAKNISMTDSEETISSSDEYISDSSENLTQLNIMFDRLKNAAKNEKKVRDETAKATILSQWCCMFDRDKRPTGAELCVALSHEAHKISKSLKKKAEENDEIIHTMRTNLVY